MFIETIEERQGLKIAARRRSPSAWAASTRDAAASARRSRCVKTGYGEYLLRMLAEEHGRP